MEVETLLTTIFKSYFFLVISISLAFAISLIDRKRINYSQLKRWLIILVRYYLAFQMIGYGIAKLFYLQFPFPNVLRFDQELGDFSPMGLLWTFMGYSKGYTMFTGALEFIGGMLLFSRKTLTLGALTTFGVMINVMMLNYCYDVPVKLLSTHMVIIALYLISIDLKRIIQFFISNESVTPRPNIDLVPDKFIKAKNIIKWIALIGYLGFSFYRADQRSKEFGPKSTKPLFYGKYVVEDVERKAIIFPELAPEPSELEEWKTFIQGWKGYATIKTKTSKEINYNFESDTTKNIVKFKQNNASNYHELKYDILANDRVELYGIYKSDSIRILMRKEDLSKRTLVGRKFNWINEYPFNR